MVNSVTDFPPPQPDPRYQMPKGYRPVFLADDATFCIRIFNACQKKGHIPQGANRDHFVEQCRNRLPEIPMTRVGGEDPSISYLWDFRNSAGIWADYYPKAHNNFGVYQAGKDSFQTVDNVLQKAANSQATDKNCKDFSDGGPGMTAQKKPHGAVISKSALLAPAQREAVDLPGDLYPEAAMIPGLRPATATADATWVHAAHALRNAEDKIAFGVAVVMGAIVLVLTKGALPPLESPVTPSFSPVINTTERGYPGA